ncbi:hypothetical protein EKD04_018220 [Chloroflexales bacterium ZM16-3]|nr:hypothetical protein [Chloroflexales bacterium ZM16-3]
MPTLYAANRRRPCAPMVLVAAAIYVTFLQEYLSLDQSAVIGVLACINGLILQRLFDG